eukprot:Skav232344  [mRNA]  locus=scaffold2646:50731:50934:- [translate_table: standard]
MLYKIDLVTSGWHGYTKRHQACVEALLNLKHLRLRQVAKRSVALVICSSSDPKLAPSPTSLRPAVVS